MDRPRRLPVCGRKGFSCKRLGVALVAAVLSAVTAGIPRSAAGQNLDLKPVFFVHGHGADSSDWRSLIDTLVANGYPREFLRTIDLVPVTSSNRDAADAKIAPAIDAFLVDVNAFLETQGYAGAPKTRVALIGHSMGGVSTRRYVTVVAPERVDTWISLAGANHGTDALCPYVGADAGGAAELCPAYSVDPHDTVQLTLNGRPEVDVDETPFGIGVDSPGVAVVPADADRRVFYATIRAGSDVWIVPGESSVVDGAGGRPVTLAADFPAVETSPGNFLLTNDVDHVSILADARVAELVALLLEAEDPPPVAAAAPWRMRGHGHIDRDAVRHVFGFRVVAAEDADGGRLEYRLQARPPALRADRFVSTAVSAVAFSDNPTAIVFRGVGRWNGAPGYAFEAQATDGGHATGRDSFALTITAPDGTVAAAVGGSLSGGTIRSGAQRARP